MEEPLITSTSGDVELGKSPQRSPQRSRLKPYTVIVAATASLGGLIFGFQLTASGGTFLMTGFQEHFGWACAPDAPTCTPLTENQIETERAIISAMLTVGATVGALVNPFFVDRFGRVPDLKLACVVFILGALCCALAPAIGVMYVGRFVAGFSVGMFALCVPVYIGECSPVDYRGQLMTTWQFGVTVGMLIGQGVNIGLQHLYWGWRMSYSLNGAFALLLFVALSTYMPESPRFVASRRIDDADEVSLVIQRNKLKEIMQKLRYEQDVDHAIEAIEKEVQEDRELGEASWSEVFETNNRMRYRIFLGVAIQAFNQLSGNEAINFYSPTIMENMFGGQSIFLSFLIGIVNFIAVCVSILTIDKFGRLPLFFIGGVTMFFTQVANSIYQSMEGSSTTIDILFFTSLCVFSFAYHSTWGPLAWDICGEMFPLRERGKATGVTTMSNFIFNTVVAVSFSYTIDASPMGSFAFFCACIFANLVIAYFYLPETAHKNPEEMESTFMNHKPTLLRWKCE